MFVRSGTALCILLALIAFCARPATAQLGDQLSAYTGENAKGYLEPLVDAIGADLNAGIFGAAGIPVAGPRILLEFPIMSVLFSDDDKVFNAVTEGDFSPKQRAQAPTVVGSTKAVIVDGDGGSQFAFPGGFDLSSFTLAAPQLRVGVIMGTELLLRYFAMQVGDDDLGKINLFGIGARHNITQHLGDKLPVDLAAGFFWQSLKLGEDEESNDIVSTSAFSIGVQASKEVVRFLVPYAGLSYDSKATEITYMTDEFGAEETINVDYEREGTAHLTIGLMLDLPGVRGFAEYNLASQSSFVLGIGLGYGG